MTLSPKNHPSLSPGQRAAVIQQIPQRDQVWTTRVEGEVVRCEQKKTGSWFAHGKDDKLWLDRLTLRKDDGEIVVCILDQYSRIEVLNAAPTLKSSEAPVESIESAESTETSESS